MPPVGKETASVEQGFNIDWSLVAEIISSILGLWSTFLLTKGDGRGWALGALMSFAAGYVFFSVKLYGSFAVQLLFLTIQLTGLWKWWTGADRDLRNITRRMTPRQAIGLVLVWSSVAFGLGLILQDRGGNFPFLDGVGTTGNVLAQIALMMAWPECWVIYMITNICYIVLNYRSGLEVYTALYSIYMFVALRGWLQWTKEA